jgi:hypothetical protein
VAWKSSIVFAASRCGGVMGQLTVWAPSASVQVPVRTTGRIVAAWFTRVKPAGMAERVRVPPVFVLK